VSRTVRTLIGKGLLAKAEIQPKGRAEALDLTPAGRRLLDSDPTLELETVLARLTEADQDATARALELVLTGVSGGPRA
jgi:DNA-binding MarR family transcriptional regulator